MTKRARSLPRRSFLLGAGAGGVVAAAAIIAGAPPRIAQEPGRGKRASRGYQVSEHIDNYYRTTKV